jgi:hypothetical protein
MMNPLSQILFARARKHSCLAGLAITISRSALVLCALLLIQISALAQDNFEACASNRTAPATGTFYWPPDTEVKVYLVRNMFTPEQRRTMFEAMDNWTSGAQAMGAGVKFTFVGESDSTAVCAGCLTVTRREVYKYDDKHYAFFSPLARNADGSLFSAWIDLDFATTDPQAVKGFIAHELGHGLGLLDCPTCGKKQTIMNAFPDINQDNGLVAPSACDLAVVKQVYSTQAKREGQSAKN